MLKIKTAGKPTKCALCHEESQGVRQCLCGSAWHETCAVELNNGLCPDCCGQEEQPKQTWDLDLPPGLDWIGAHKVAMAFVVLSAPVALGLSLAIWNVGEGNATSLKIDQLNSELDRTRHEIDELRERLEERVK